MFDVDTSDIKSFEKQLDKMVRNAPKKVVAPALRKSAKRAKNRIITKISGEIININTGNFLRAWSGAKIRVGRGNRRDFVRLGISVPDREAFGISADDKHFYPYALEYGTATMPARPHMRTSIDDYRTRELPLIGKDIADGIEKHLKKK